jgi:isopenicillin N synthase-like dioxygenase
MAKIDSKGTPDRCEFWGFSKDEILSHKNPQRTLPLVEEYHAFLATFTKRAHTLCLDLLSHFERHLSFAVGTLSSLHRLQAISSDQVRVLKMAPQPHGDERTSLLAHTDFGSITLLWNVIGGLQILPPEAGDSDVDGTSNGWQYVKPEDGYVIVNIGDAMVMFSGGRLRSNLHRVTAVPGEQGRVERYSAAYFMRPEDDVLMQALDGDKEGGNLYTAKEWVALRSNAVQKAMVPMQSNGGRHA